MEFVTEVSEFVRLKEEPAEPEAEPERRPPGAARAVHIKEEPQNEHQSDSDEMEDCLQHTTSEYEIKEDPSCFENIVSDVIHGLCDGRVKDEVMQPESVPQIPQTASCSNMECVSEAAMLAGLYMDHDVKDELVLGAECPYRPDVTLVVHGRIGHTLRDCSVTLEHIPHIDVLAKRQGTTSSDTESDTDKFTFRDEFHTEEKEPLCDLCGERFSVKSDLVKHVIDHIHRPPSMEQEGGAQGNAFAGQCQQEQERALCRKYAIQDCRVRLERLRHQEALAANDTQHTDTEIDAEDIHTRVDNGKPTCGLCGDSFALKSDLDQHIMTHIHMPTAQRSQDPSPDKESDIGFNFESDLNRHTGIHSVIKPYSCDVCSEGFVTMYGLKRHTLVHAAIKPYSCKVCKKGFIGKSALNVHALRHCDMRPYSCDVCKKRFRTKIYLKQHTLIHSNIRPYSCDVCKKGFSTVKFLKKHSLRHSDVRTHNCDVCKKGFLTIFELKRHTLVHNDIRVRPYSCDICKKGFLTISVLKRHALVHTDISTYSCDICKKGFLFISELKRHTLVHTDIRPYSCDICKKGFLTKSGLKNHLLRHSDVRTHYCDVCKKGFLTIYKLKRHRLVHTDIRPYSCDVCKKRFKTDAYLKRHMLFHSDITPYSCDVCKKRFKTVDYLKRHMLFHSDIRPYSCDVCKKRFRRKSNLKSHTRIHKNIKTNEKTILS
ncbi:zinc finger protein 493-like isoform X1 [Leguminivora glycinivorella]|uniref:zinc finger protein 493-like isoform X1 n=1 Tax=Leguminivora glycinivorella TaxID=1035111 RepID=UPI00200BEC16|nr:zinc finger protein 493-like isoform X1 [Leguminivora glycinivorella]